ncbi:MAG: hypothetical protein VZR11_01450 [Succinimonas sp.]|nr:hypothetical protein [Succinimonas sp.]
MKSKKSDELKQAVIKAKCSLDEELDAFIQKIDECSAKSQFCAKIKTAKPLF